MKQKLLFCAFLLSFAVQAQQNLVPNGSFEQIAYCPQLTLNFSPVEHWISPTLGTPDYFNLCNETVPQNIWGNQYARTGNAYVGISVGESLYREYIQCNLIEPLEAGKSYIVTFYVSRGDSSGGACNNIGAYFSTIAISALDNTLSLPYTPQVSSDFLITDNTDWVQISATYIATGGELYVTIGNFADSENTNWILVDSNSQFLQQAYYFIDDVTVVEYSVPLQMPTAFSPNEDNKNDNYYPVFFDSSLIIREFRIYNRWGQKLHDNPAIGWNGIYEGELQPPDEYSYYIYADIPLPDNPNERATLKKQGSFALLR